MALIHLAQNQDRGAWSAREIAERYGIPLELMAKILQKLVQRGVLVSHHGTNGGYLLARSAGAITAADVISAIEGPLSLTSCLSDDGFCVQFERFNVNGPLQPLNDTVVQLLSHVTIAEMSHQQQMDLRPEMLNDSPFLVLKDPSPETNSQAGCQATTTGETRRQRLLP